jgi:rod shape-determining protein MreD
MRNLLAVPFILLVVMLQTAVVSRITLLDGFADLPLVVVAAWALQEEVESEWHWAIAIGVLVGFVSGIPLLVPVLGYSMIVILAKVFQRRVWQAPLLAMFSVTFLGTILMSIMSIGVLRLSGIPLDLGDSLGLLVLPAVLLNMLVAIPVYAIMRDFAGWMYPTTEAG